MPQPPPPPSKRHTAARLAKLECFYDELKGNPRAILIAGMARGLRMTGLASYHSQGSVSGLANPVDGDRVLDVLVRATITIGVIAPDHRLGARLAVVVQPRVELLIAGHPLLLVAALETALLVSAQHGDLRAGAIRVGACANEANASRLVRGRSIDLRRILIPIAPGATEETGVVMHIAIGRPSIAQFLGIAPIR